MKATKVGHFSGHINSIYALTASLHPDQFYSGATDGFVVAWNHVIKGDGELLVNVKKPVYCLLPIPSKNELWIGTASGNLHVVDLASKKEIRNIEAHKQGLFDLKEAGEHIISVGEDGFIHIWNKSDFVLLHSIHASKKSGRAIAIAESRNEFAVGFSDHKIRIYDLTTFELKQVIDGHTNSVFALTYTPDMNYLLSGGRDAQLHIWDTKKRYALSQTIPAHNLHINAITYNPSGNLFASVSMDKTLKIWNEKFELLKVIDKIKNDGHTSSVNKVFWVDDTHLITCSDDKQMMMWEIAE